MTARKRAKIILITPRLPYPTTAVTNAPLVSLIRALGGEYDVTILTNVLSEKELAGVPELEQWCRRVVPVLAPYRKSVLHRLAYKIFYQLKSATMRRSLKTLYDCPGTILRAARELSQEHFDLVVISYWQLYAMATIFSEQRKLLITHGIDILINREVSLLERNLVRKIQSVRRWLLERQEELATYKKARHIWTLTKQDKATVEAICRDNCSVDVMPFGLDLEFHAPSGMQRNTGEVLFIADMRAANNRDALEYFVTKIYPHLHGLDGLSITVVSENLPSELEYFRLLPEVEVVAEVADVRPYLHRASCLVAPLRFGGGLSVQILEAMAARLPVVCSQAAVAGMPFESEKELLLAEQPEDYARQIKRVLGDGGLAGGVAEAAVQRLRETFSGEVQAQRAVAMVGELIGVREGAERDTGGEGG